MDWKHHETKEFWKKKLETHGGQLADCAECGMPPKTLKEVADLLCDVDDCDYDDAVIHAQVCTNAITELELAEHLEEEYHEHMEHDHGKDGHVMPAKL